MPGWGASVALSSPRASESLHFQPVGRESVKNPLGGERGPDLEVALSHIHVSYHLVAWSCLIARKTWKCSLCAQEEDELDFGELEARVCFCQ